MTTRKVLGIGPLSPPPSGPGIKNKYLKNGLSSNDFSIDWVNTLKSRKGAVIELLKKINEYEYYILSVSTNGRFALSPLITIRLLTAGRAVLLPAGGTFSEELRNLPPVGKIFYKSIFSRFDAIFPQTESMVQDLQHIFGEQVIVSQLPNLRPRYQAHNNNNRSEALELVYVGRINESKGMTELLDAMEIVESTDVEVNLSIYGHFPSSESYKEIFQNRVSQLDIVQYCGEIPHDEVIEKMSDHDIFVFPTYYVGEGCPGVIVEAFMAGLPVVATDWNYNSEFVVDGYNGKLIKPKSAKSIVERILELYYNRHHLDELRQNALCSSEKYTVEKVTESFVDVISDCGWKVVP